MKTWNSHSMRIGRNMSPLQRWIEGFYRLEFSDGDLLGLTEVDKSYGTDDERPLPRIETQIMLKFQEPVLI